MTNEGSRREMGSWGLPPVPHLGPYWQPLPSKVPPLSDFAGSRGLFLTTPTPPHTPLPLPPVPSIQAPPTYDLSRPISPQHD